MVNEYLDDVAAMQAQIRRRRRILVVVVALLGLSPVLICLGPAGYYAIKDALRERYSLSEAQKGEARAAITEAEGLATAHDLAFRAEILGAVEAELAPRPDLGRCPHRIRPDRSDLLGGRLADLGLDLRYRAVDREDAAGAIGQLRSRAGISLRSAALGIGSRLDMEWLDPDRPAQVMRDVRLLPRSHRPFEVILVRRLRREPTGSIATHDFTPGLVMGTAYLYAYDRGGEATGSVLCAAEIVAESSEHLEYEWTQQGLLDLGQQRAAMARALREDLSRQVQNAIAREMRWRAGPMPAEEAPAEEVPAEGPVEASPPLVEP